MAVREHWEIKGIQWIAVQEDWVTVVSQADTVNFVWWWTVTDVWGVATINIPQWVTWYREDVTAGSATYTFINSPATATSFLVFTDSGTLMFSGIDYTYDPDTETITFISLGASEAAYIWVAHAVTTWGWIWDMVKAVYDPTNINSSAFDYNNFINTPTIWNATLKIQKNGVDVNSITMNATTDVTANITVPTTVAELTDASNYVTDSELSTELSSYALASSVPTTVAELSDASDYVTDTELWTTLAWYVEASDVQIVSNQSDIPAWAHICDVYEKDGVLYFYTWAVRDNIILES